MKEIKGINSVKLLYRIGNNMNTYKDVINIFYKRFIDFEGRVSKFIDDKNIDSLYKEIHAIRGSSGNISAESLSEIGKRIESEIRTGKINEENIWKLIEELKIILESIKNSGLLVEEIKKNIEKVKFDYGNSSEVLEWLRAVKGALERQDLGARKIFESREDFIKVEEFSDEFEIIKSSLKNLEFKNAVYYITVLEDKIGGTKVERKGV